MTMASGILHPRFTSKYSLLFFPAQDAGRTFPTNALKAA